MSKENFMWKKNMYCRKWGRYLWTAPVCTAHTMALETLAEANGDQPARLIECVDFYM